MRGPAMIPEVNSALQPEYGTTHVADRSEAAHKRVRRLDARRDIVVSGVTSDRLNGIGPYQHRMPVCVNQAGHQRSPIAGDHGHAWLDCDRCRRDAFNGVAFDQHTGRRGERAALAIEDTHILEQRRAGIRWRIALRRSGGRKPDGHKRKRSENPSGHRVHLACPPGRRRGKAPA